ncbi:MAG: hypothetical protein HYU02_04540 [Thaumarchaeota archaeon]|nr:hypothetical protein [Nitrososphaerota archaeon]
MAEVDVSIQKLECTRLPRLGEEAEVTFDVNASLKETSRNPGSFVLDFEIAIDTHPPVAGMLLIGSAMITGKDEEIQNLISIEDQNSAPPIFMMIYQKIYSVLYLLAGTIAIPYPSPGLIRKTQLFSTNDISKPLRPLEITAR